MPPRKQLTSQTTAAATNSTKPTTRTRLTRTASNKTDELTATFATELTITDTKGKQRATKIVPPRAAPTRIRKVQAKDAITPPDVAQLSKSLATGLTLASQATVKSREERCTDAMREVNTASRGLSSVLESGWKRSLAVSIPAQRCGKPRGPDSEKQASGYATSAIKALHLLRELKPYNLDVERAASSLVGKLISLEMYDIALNALSEAHSAILGLYGDNSSQTRPEETALLSLPFPPTTLPHESDILLTLISNHLLYIIIATSYTIFTNLDVSQSSDSCTIPLKTFADALSDGPTLLQWLPLLEGLPPRHMDSIVTRAYTAITKASVLATCPSSDAKSMFLVRVYALQLLLHSSPSILRPTTFWDQTVKFTMAFVKDMAGQPISPDFRIDATKTVLSTLDKIYETVLSTRRKEEERESWLSGSGFMGFCEYWMEFAKRTNDLELMRRISSFVRGASNSPSEPTTIAERARSSVKVESMAIVERGKSTPTPKLRTGAKSESARVCTILTQGTSLLEQVSQSDESINQVLEDVLQTVDHAKPLLRALYPPENGAEIDEQRYADKVRRTLERLRRAAVKALDVFYKDGHGTSSAVESTRHLIRAVVEKTVVAFSSTMEVTKVAHTDMLTPILDSLFALARTTLVVSKPLTYTQAYDYLARAESLLSSAENYECDPIQLANYLRCLSGAFHNMGGTLYQAAQHSHASRFLDMSCSTGEKALMSHRAATASGFPPSNSSEDKDKQEAWSQLEDQMYRRWEILGVCHSKIGDRKAAFQSFVNCVKAFPFSKPSFFELVSSHSPSAVFDNDPSLKHVAGLIDRLTYTGTCDLLLQPPAVSLKPHFSQWYVSADVPLNEVTERRLVTGVVLERQIESLDTCRWKEHGSKAIRFLLDEVLGIYMPQDTPIRRARVILKVLEHLHASHNAVWDESISYEDLGREADLLLTRRDVGLDAGLVQFRAQYRATLKLRLALLVHREAQTSQFSKVVSYAEEACGVLKNALSAIPRESAIAVDHSPKIVRTQPNRRAVGKGQLAASRLPTVRTRIARTAKSTVITPVTPKKRGRMSLISAASSLPVISQSPPPVDDLPSLINLLRSCAHLLGLLGQIVTKVHLLIVARRICERFVDTKPNEYVILSIELAQEYVNLGKLGKAGNIYHVVTNLAKRAALSEETRVLLSLRFAESQAAAGNVLKSSSAYCEAYAASETLPDIDKGLPTTQRIFLRANVLERAAVAASTFAMIQYSRDDPSAAINGLLQALRLWNRAVDTLSRVAPVVTMDETSDSDNPFLAEPATDLHNTAANGKQANLLSPGKSVPRRPALSGIEWRVAHGLLVTLFALTQAYVARGSPREAEYFAQQAKDVAESLNTPAMAGRALARIGEIYLHLHQVEDSHASLAKAANFVAGTAGPDAVEIRRLRAEHSRLHSNGKEAQQLYEEAMAMLEELDGVFAALDGQIASSRKSLGGLSPKSPRTSGQPETLAPSVLMTILGQNIRLLHEEGEEYTSLLERFRALSSTTEAKAEENALLAKLSLENVYTRFQADMFLNSLSESVITLPTGMVSSKPPPASSGQEVLGILNHAEKLFWSDLALISRRGNVFDVRDAAVSLALIRAFQTSVGGSLGDSPILVARLLDMSAAITLQREVLEVVQHKFPDLVAQDDLQWPLMTSNGSVMPPPKRKNKARFVSFGSDDEDDGIQELSDDPLKRYWDVIGNKYRNQVCDASSLANATVDVLPREWTVISISVTEDRNTMFVTRQRPCKEPLMFCIPLKERRESVDEDDEFLGFDAAIRELDEIIQLSDDGTRQAQHIRDDRSARQAWWAARTALDERLKVLLENIEFYWFGAFKAILNDPVDYPKELLKAFRTQIELVLKRSMPMKGRKQKDAVHLNDALLECFASLSPKCRDEEIADLVYFILDLYQFSGTPIAVAEVDVDEVVIDLRAALEEHSARCQSKVRPADDAHTFLVLDKNIAGLPWESLPVLRGRSVSRIPSVDFLLDRIQLCQQMGHHPRQQNHVDRVIVDPKKTYYVLNPSGDLKNTEGRFAGWLRDMSSVGWEGVVGRPPSELQLSNALTRKDLVIYFGHGGAEQYIRSHKLRHLPRCAATMLWGCSSGALKHMGDFDRVGTPYNYMLAGCPTLVANLWDVTDRDIDKFSQAVFDKMHLSKDRVSTWTPTPGREETSIVAAVARSREVCKLKYLTGAAPVVYGIPFYL